MGGTADTGRASRVSAQALDGVTRHGVVMADLHICISFVGKYVYADAPRSWHRDSCTELMTAPSSQPRSRLGGLAFAQQVVKKPAWGVGRCSSLAGLSLGEEGHTVEVLGQGRLDP